METGSEWSQNKKVVNVTRKDGVAKAVSFIKHRFMYCLWSKFPDQFGWYLAEQSNKSYLTNKSYGMRILRYGEVIIFLLLGQSTQSAQIITQLMHRTTSSRTFSFHHIQRFPSKKKFVHLFIFSVSFFVEYPL